MSPYQDDLYYDTEFLEQGADHPLHLISVGFIDTEGETLYGINADAPWHLIREHPWLRDNVLPHLPGSVGPYGWRLDYSHPDVLPRQALAAAVRRYVLSHTSPRLNAWFSSHDHVAITGLFGPMVNLPTGFPMRTHDVTDDWDRAGNPEIPPMTTASAHHALDDARYVRHIADHLRDLEGTW